MVLRSEMKLSNQVPPSSEGGPRFFPVGHAPGSTANRSGESTAKELACWSPPTGVPSAAVVDNRWLQVVGRKAERALCILSSDEPWPPKAIAEIETRPKKGSLSSELGRATTIRSRTVVNRSKDMSVTIYIIFVMERSGRRFAFSSWVVAASSRNKEVQKPSTGALF